MTKTGFWYILIAERKIQPLCEGGTSGESMELYRKYRPKTFDDVIGQAPVTRTLTAQVAKNRIGHAYLFTGTRGTGKTTCAKIFARAINCLRPQEGSPCGECEVCKALESASNLDVVEMDAASNNGVDAIREMIDSTKYPPVSGKYKVYVIDEVHMLSPGAFNAFLKTLEEPPPYVVFILATTEVHKLPQTIVSRCMRFDFRLVAEDKIASVIKRAYDGEGVAYDEDAVELIARAGEGSVRDALSVADRCIQPGGRVEAEAVADILGTSRKDDIYALFDAVCSGNAGDALKITEKMGKEGRIMAIVAKDFVTFVKDVLLVKTAQAEIAGSERHKQAVAERAARTSADTLIAALTIFSAADADLRYSVSPLVTFEMTALRAARLYDADYSALEERVSRLERGGVVPAGSASAQTETEQKKNDGRPMDAIGIWGRLTTYFRRNESMTFYSVVSEQRDVRIEQGNLVVTADSVSYDSMLSPALHEALLRALADDGVELRLVIERKESGVDMDKEAERMKKWSGSAKFRIIKQ